MMERCCGKSSVNRHESGLVMILSVFFELPEGYCNILILSIVSIVSVVAFVAFVFCLNRRYSQIIMMVLRV